MADDFLASGAVMVDPAASMTLSQLYDLYFGWAKARGARPMIMPRFSRYLADNEIPRARINGRVRVLYLAPAPLDLQQAA